MKVAIKKSLLLILYNLIIVFNILVISRSINMKMNSKLLFNLKNTPKDVAAVHEAELEPKNEDLPLVPIYYETWIKYFRYLKKSPNKKAFFINNEYNKELNQVKYKNETQQNDEVLIYLT